MRPGERLEVLFEELAELTGQRNAIDGRVVEIVAEIDRDGLCGATGARSVAALVAWKTGTSPGNANTIADRRAPARGVPALRGGDAGGPAVAGSGRGHRREGRRRSDAHYAQLAAVATVNQLRTAVKLEPRPDPDPTRPNPSLSPIGYAGRSRRGRSPRPATSSPPPGGSRCRAWTRRSSTPPWSPIATR